MRRSRSKWVLKSPWAGFLALVTVACLGKAAEPEKTVDFQTNVEEVFTKRGCNDNHCHGGVKGRGGFKLSFNGLDPHEDYKWIVKGGTYQVLSPEPKAPLNPRIDLKEPEKSLLLLKPSFAVPHGGGERFKVGSDDYLTLFKWIREGAPYGDEADAKIDRLEVSPASVFLPVGGKQQIRIIGHFPDGRREDLTSRVLYESGNPGVVKVTPEGLVSGESAGETPILIRSPGRFAYARIGVFTQRIAHYPHIPSRNFIDDYVFQKLRNLNIIPSELSSDSEFVRRVCLDMTGTLPPPGRVREFVASRDPHKREKLVEVLLNSPEYVDYWTFRFADLFRVGRGTQSAATVGMPWDWVRDSVATNKPYDQMARERIAAHGYNGPSRYFEYAGETVAFEKKMAEQFRLFWGRRLECAQCHNHPYEAWTQEQFWGLAAFFSRVTSTSWNVSQVIFDDPDGPEHNYGDDGKTSLSFIKAVNPRTKKEVEPRFLDGRVLPQQSRTDLRMELAKWMTAQDEFSEAAVNRIWGCFFSRGIVDPVDDFRSNNPPTHPELLAALSRDFREHGYDLKHLIRLIVNSRTYQLSSIPNETNQDELMNYSRAMPRPLDAEVLLDAITATTGIPEVFEISSEHLKAPAGTRAIQLILPAHYPSRFMEVYGRPFRDSLPERDANPNLAQALDILVGTTYTKKLASDGGRLDQLLKSGRSDRDVVDELFLAALARLPSPEEFAGVEKLCARESRRQFMQMLLWALISSREFAYNH